MSRYTETSRILNELVEHISLIRIYCFDWHIWSIQSYLDDWMNDTYKLIDEGFTIKKTWHVL